MAFARLFGFVVSISINNHNNKALTLYCIARGSCLGLLWLSVGYGLALVQHGRGGCQAVNSLAQVTLPLFYPLRYKR